MRSVIGLSALAVLLLGCPEQRTERADAGELSAPDSGAGDAGVEPIDAGPPAPTTLGATVTAALADGGTAAVVANGEFDPPIALTVSLPVQLKDFRIRLMDWRDQVVTSDDELQADGRTLRISLPEPLKTGRSYTLVLDAELGPVVTAQSGRTYNDWELPFRIAGEVQPDKPQKPAPRKPKKK
jgi:hypothetical protein